MRFSLSQALLASFDNFHVSTITGGNSVNELDENVAAGRLSIRSLNVLPSQHDCLSLANIIGLVDSGCTPLSAELPLLHIQSFEPCRP
jgi:hypothetical protein